MGRGMDSGIGTGIYLRESRGMFKLIEGWRDIGGRIAQFSSGYSILDFLA